MNERKADFLEIVTNRADKKLKEDNVKCPYCESKNVEEKGHTTTLLAGFSGNDPNHHWRSQKCLDCNKEFTLESKEGNSWYVGDRGKILKGLPSCFESYLYTCSKCGGDVERHNCPMDSDNVLSSCGYDEKGLPTFRTVFRCESCGESVESLREYAYSPFERYDYDKNATDREERRNKPVEPPVLLGWEIYETIGTAIVNLPKDSPLTLSPLRQSKVDTSKSCE